MTVAFLRVPSVMSTPADRWLRLASAGYCITRRGWLVPPTVSALSFGLNGTRAKKQTTNKEGWAGH